MPPTLIPAPSFTPIVDDADFDADFDLPEGDTVIGPPANTRQSGEADEEEDWDNASPLATEASGSAGSSRFGTVTNLSLKPKVQLPQATSTSIGPEDWDDDEDFDLPPPSSQPLRLSVSPRTKVRMDNSARESAARSSQDLNSIGLDLEDFPDEEGNASTIKVSKLAFTAAMSRPPPSTPPKMIPLPPSPTPPEDDFEDDFYIPDALERLSLRVLPTLTHRVSKSSSDPWGDHTSSTIVSDASSSTVSQPSPYHSSQPSTEDESDGLAEEGEFDGLVLPDTLSPRDMQRMLEDKKKGLRSVVPDRVKVARPSDGEDDFESGLVIGADDDFSPSRLKKPVFSSRAVGKGTTRSHSAPNQLSSTVPMPSFPRPPSSLREQVPAPGSSRGSRGTVRSPTLLVPGTTLPATRPTQEAFPTLRRTPSTLVTTSSSRPAPTRWQTFSTAIRPSPSILLPVQTNAIHRPVSPTKIPLPVSNSPSPFLTPLPIPSSPTPSRPLERSSTSAGAGPSSGTPSMIRHQKSHSKLPSMSVNPPLVKKMSRKASLSSLVDAQAASNKSSSPSPSPEIPFSPSQASIVGRRPLRKGLAHAASYRDLGGGTVGPSSSSPGTGGSSGIPIRRFGYEAPTAAYSARRATARSGPTYDELTSGSDREKERRPMIPASATSRSLARMRGAISNIFPSTSISTASLAPSASSPSPSPLARSPSPIFSSSSRQAALSLKPTSSSKTNPPQPPPTIRIMRRPKKARIFGDGTELDGIEDLNVEREKESKFRVAPSGRGNVGTRPKTAGALLGGASTEVATIGRRSGGGAVAKAATSIAANARPDSSVSSRASMDPPRLPSELRRLPRMEFPRVEAATATPGYKKKNSPSAIRKPTLIRNLSGVGSAKVVNGMKWNPMTLRWEGNEGALRDFEVSASTRPALITHLTGSSVGGIASPPGTFRSLANGARVVGDMMFDPVKMCWLSKTGEEEDPFAAMDDITVADEDEDDWDADGKGGTIRAVISSLGIAHEKKKSGTGLSSEESSPARSISSRRRGSTQHTRSASESDSESVAGSLPGGGSTGLGGGRESSLGSAAAMTMINEDDDNVTFPVPRELVAACMAAEERHRGETRGWQVSSMMGSTASSRRRLSRSSPSSPAGSPGSSRTVTDVAIEETNRNYLHDIRVLAFTN